MNVPQSGSEMDLNGGETFDRVWTLAPVPFSSLVQICHILATVQLLCSPTKQPWVEDMLRPYEQSFAYCCSLCMLEGSPALRSWHSLEGTHQHISTQRQSQFGDQHTNGWSVASLGHPYLFMSLSIICRYCRSIRCCCCCHFARKLSLYPVR